VTSPAAADPGERRVPVPLAVLILVGTLLLSVVVVGAVVWVSTPRLSTGPAVAPPPPSSTTSTVELDEKTQTATVQEMRVQLPEVPYECSPDAAESPPIFPSARTCNALVHPNYDSRGHDWYASFGIAVVSPSLVVQGNLRATGDQVYEALRGRLFPSEPTTLKKRSTGPLDIAPAGKAIAISSEVHYAVPGLSSSYDRMLLIVVELADGEHAVCYSVRPNDTPKATLAALNGSLNTLLAK
jgi:hypothetical protein